MGEKKPIYKLVDELPSSNLTTRLLNVLDFVTPGEWQNTIGFENTIQIVTGETDEKWIQQIGERAIVLYNDKSQGYQRAMWLYQTVDSVDRKLAKAALANKVGGIIRFLSFLSRLTPKADTLQTLDFSLKLVTELVAFCLISGIPGDSVNDFVKAVGTYEKESIARMSALIAVDGLIPLGPDFIQLVGSTLNKLDPDELEKNAMYQKIQSFIPGGNTTTKLAFMNKGFDAIRGWMDSFVTERNITREGVLSNLKGYVEFTDDKLDYLAAFLDITTNYYEHTGTQTLARRLIERAVNEI